MAVEEKLDQIIEILKRIETTLLNKPISPPANEEPKRKLPMHKDPVIIAEMRKQIIDKNNQKIDRAIEKGKKGLKLTKHEEIIYKLHLEKQFGR
jgi:hypothetical protein